MSWLLISIASSYVILLYSLLYRNYLPITVYADCYRINQASSGLIEAHSFSKNPHVVSASAKPDVVVIPAITFPLVWYSYFLTVLDTILYCCKPPGHIHWFNIKAMIPDLHLFGRTDMAHPTRNVSWMAAAEHPEPKILMWGLKLG